MMDRGVDLDDLDDSQLGQILQHLVTRFDDSGELAITEEEVVSRTEKDRRFLSDAAEALAVVPDDRPSLRTVLETLAAEIPETRPTIEDAAARVRRVGTLPLSDMAADILVIAASAAILRPKLTFRRTAKGDDRDVKLTFEAGGGKGLGTVLRTVLSFLRNDAP